MPSSVTSDIERWLTNTGPPVYHPDIENVDWPEVTKWIPHSCKTTFCGHHALATEDSGLVFAVATETVVILRLPTEMMNDVPEWQTSFAKSRSCPNLNNWWVCESTDNNDLKCLAAYHATLGLSLTWTVARPKFLPFGQKKINFTVHRLDAYTRQVQAELRRLSRKLSEESATSISEVGIEVRCDNIRAEDLKSDLLLS